MRALAGLALAAVLLPGRQEAAARVCRLPAPTLATAADTAAWCAREFLIRNGYTAAPASADRNAIALEPTMDVGRTFDEMMFARRNTVGDAPLLACPTATGFLVSFSMPNQLDPTHGRGVSMTRTYAGLTLLRSWVQLSAGVPPHCIAPHLPTP
jgi:hypothetical protein